MQEIMQSEDLGFTKKESADESLMQVAESRAVAEVQAAYVIAKKFLHAVKKRALRELLLLVNVLF